MEDNVRVTKVIQDIRFNLEETLWKLEEVWTNIGLRDEQKEERCRTITQHFNDLSSEMYKEECDLEAKLKIKISEYEKELEQLYNDLHEDPPEKVQLSLAELETKLRSDADTLNKKKYDRLKCLRRLRDDEMELCEYLVIPQITINFVGCPAQDQLRELEQHIVMLKSEKATRTNTFEKLREGIVALWDQLDIGPENEFELKLYDDTVSSLPEDFIHTLEELHAKLNQEYLAMLTQIEEQRQKFALLWGALKEKISKTDTIHIAEPPDENTGETLKILNENIEQLNIVKKQHLKKFICTIQEELHSIWDKCFFGEEQRKNCLEYYCEKYTEESLEYHEQELVAIKQHYETNKELYKAIAKREALWEEKVKLENNSENLLNTRGGALLKALTRKQRIAKQLPKLDKELGNRIAVWELHNGKSFMFKDSPYLEYVEKQHSEHETDEKSKRDQKQLAKKKELSEEMKFGSKRKCATPTHLPANTKNKFARMDSTLMKKGNSNNRSVFGAMNNTHTVYRSPVATKLKYSKPTLNSANKGSPGNSKEKTAMSIFTHSSIKQIKQEKNVVKKKKKVIDSKLVTEWGKKRRSRRSIKGSTLKEICLNAKAEAGNDVYNDEMSYDEFENGLESEKPFSSSSVVKPNEPSTPEISVIGYENAK